MDDALNDASSRPPIATLFTQLVDDTKQFARAEVALYRTKAGKAASSAGVAAGLFGAAIVLLLGAIVALFVGLILILSEMMEAWAATAIVVGASLVLAALLAWLGYAKVKTIFKSEHAA